MNSGGLSPITIDLISTRHEPDPRPRDQILDGRGHDDLAILGDGRDAPDDIESGAAQAVGSYFAFARFYALHVWAWKHNPHGMFVDWNPKVSCEGFTNGAVR